MSDERLPGSVEVGVAMTASAVGLSPSSSQLSSLEPEVSANLTANVSCICQRRTK